MAQQQTNKKYGTYVVVLLMATMYICVYGVAASHLPMLLMLMGWHTEKLLQHAYNHPRYFAACMHGEHIV